MGLGIVLLFWGIVGLVLAAAAAAALIAIVYLVDRRRQRWRPWWLIIAAALPFMSLAYGAAGFVVYAVYCEMIRDVDLGIGDGWRVPLGQGYTLKMIDTSEQAYVEAPSGQQLHFGLTRIGTAGTFIVGEDEHGFFAVDAARRSEQVFPSEGDARHALPSDLASHLELVEPGPFYDRHRWTYQDAIAALLLVAPPFVALCLLAARFARA